MSREAVIYFANEADASNNVNGYPAPQSLGPSPPPANQIYTLDEVNLYGTTPPAPISIPSGNTFGGWVVQSSTDPAALSLYQPGDTVPAAPGPFPTVPQYSYFLYPLWATIPPCFLEGSTLLCLINGQDTHVPIEQIRKGTLVKTALDGYKAVDIIGHSKLHNPSHSLRSQNRLFKCPVSAFPELQKDLIITGCHSILVDNLTDAHKDRTMELLNKIYITGNKYRLMACIDERAVPYCNEGVHTIWHLALENTNYYNNYGVYANGELLVETTSQRYLKELSGMELVE
jgi:hypothetical protein